VVGVRAPVLALRTKSCRWKQEDAPNRRLCVSLRGGGGTCVTRKKTLNLRYLKLLFSNSQNVLSFNIMTLSSQVRHSFLM
jgi:hypothetical protein